MYHNTYIRSLCGSMLLSKRDYIASSTVFLINLVVWTVLRRDLILLVKSVLELANKGLVGTINKHAQNILQWIGLLVMANLDFFLCHDMRYIHHIHLLCYFVLLLEYNVWFDCLNSSTHVPYLVVTDTYYFLLWY